jgi:hypothetical protein
MARELDVDLSLQNKYTAVFDYSSPQIGQVKTVSVGAITKLVVPVTDPGQFASGIATKGVQIRYKLSEQDSWRSASVYLSGKDTYVAEIPSPGEDKIVRFLIDAQDNDGNTATLEGQYVYQKPAQPLQNQSSGNEVNPPSQSEGIPLLFVVAGFIILIVVIYAIYRFKFSGRE